MVYEEKRGEEQLLTRNVFKIQLRGEKTISSAKAILLISNYFT
jgi:hypothetical protein